MTQDATRSLLRETLLSRYEDLKRRLARRLGSLDLAEEALQDTFVRLEGASEIGPVRLPAAYLFRMALNIALNRQIADARLLRAGEIAEMLDIPEPAPGPAEIAEARSELAAMTRALEELPRRRRQIFLSSWVEGVPHDELSTRFGVSLRTIQSELKLAVDHCARRMKRNLKENL